ncbi:Pre-mRNA-splicing factor cwf16 [Pestalotiopsis sp. IQ-011]
MAERKVLTKYYPPDFDPSALTRKRGPKAAGPKVQTVRLMAPFSMQCLRCGEFIYKGRKFNSRKETPENERYLGIQIFRFYIRCTRCSSEITFVTDPKNGDYRCERGAKRNVEPWRQNTEDETDEQRLARLEQEEEERNAMVELEAKTVDAKREMAVADALDEIRTRNARLQRAERDGVEFTVAAPEDDDAARQDREDEEAAKAAFAAPRRVDDIVDEVLEDSVLDTDRPPPPLPTLKKLPPVKKTGPTALGIKKKATNPEPEPTAQVIKAPEKKPMASLVSYDSDSD